MATSISVSVVVCAFLAGCGSSLQVGLANAPSLGHDRPETRVHDVIANGHDACERSGFPQGEVLRGHVPPCGAETSVAVTSAAFLPGPPPRTRVPPWHRLGVCARPGPGFTRSETSLTGISVSTRTVVCEPAR
jgi:hypothetical protein